MYNIPILLVIFKRKDAALKTLQAIKTVKPAKLYIAADGARDTVEGELEKVKQTRQAVLDAIDWECEVKTRLSEKNQGCANGVYNAIIWLFDNEDRGIVITMRQTHPFQTLMSLADISHVMVGQPGREHGN